MATRATSRSGGRGVRPRAGAERAGAADAPRRAAQGPVPGDEGAGEPYGRSPVGLDEIAPWYAAGALFTVLGLLAGGVGPLRALAAGAGVLAVGAAVWLMISRNS